MAEQPTTLIFDCSSLCNSVKPWSHHTYVHRAGCLRAVYGRNPWRSQDHLAGASRSWPQPQRSCGRKSVVVGRREVCEHVRKPVYGPRLPYGHLWT